MRVSVQYSEVSHVRVERIDTGDGPWHKLYITDCGGRTDELCLFGRHNWPHVEGRAYDDIGWQGFDAVVEVSDRGDY